jgi:hypothetical protein
MYTVRWVSLGGIYDTAEKVSNGMNGVGPLLIKTKTHISSSLDLIDHDSLIRGLLIDIRVLDHITEVHIYGHARLHQVCSAGSKRNALMP